MFLPPHFGAGLRRVVLADPNYRVTRPVWCGPTHGYIGRIPKSSEGGKEWPRASQFLRVHQNAYQEFSFSGPPGMTEHTNPFNGVFYVILRDRPKFDATATRRHMIQALTWGGRAAENDQVITWNPLIDSSGTDVEIYNKPGGDSQAPDDWGVKSTGVFISNDINNPVDDDAHFQCGTLTFENLRFAAISIWNCPKANGEYQRAVCGEWHCGQGDIVVGAQSYAKADCVDRLGGLRRYVSDGDAITLDTVEMNTRRCLFQTGHPAGWWSASDSWTHLHGNFRFPVYPRNTLRCATNDTRTVQLSPAFVVLSATPGAAVRYTIGSEIVTWLCTTTITTPTLVSTDTVADYTIDKIDATTWDDEVRFCDIEIAASSQSAEEEILIATVSLWEEQPFVKVTPPTLESIAVTPQNGTYPPENHMTATGTYSDSSTADLTATATWTSSDETHITVDSAGVVSGVGYNYGTSVIRATYDAIYGEGTMDFVAS